MAKFEELSPEIKEKIDIMKSRFHVRNGKHHEDGSLGDIRISPDEFNQVLTDMYLEGYHDH